MFYALQQYLSSNSTYCQLCKTKNNHLLRTCEEHYWCSSCNEFITDYYGYRNNNFCFLCRNQDWCKKVYNALNK